MLFFKSSVHLTVALVVQRKQMSILLMFIYQLCVVEDRHCLFKNKYSLNEAVDAIDLF